LAEDEESHDAEEDEDVHLRGKAYHPAGSTTLLLLGTNLPFGSKA
jgi:hypothetical protein